MDLTNLSEQEQIAVIQSWLKKYVPSIVIGIVLAFALSFGWHQWTKRKAVHVQQASALYEQMLGTKMQHVDQSNILADTIIKQYSDTPYATFAALFQASLAVDENNLDLAVNKLNWVISHAKNYDYRQIATLRLARIQIAQNKLLEALNTLNGVKDQNFESEVELIKGDIFVIMKNYNAAKIAYQNSLKLLPDNANIKSLVKMKLANIRN